MSRDELMDSIIEKVHIIANATSMRELDIAHVSLREEIEKFSIAHRRRLNFEGPVPEINKCGKEGCMHLNLAANVCDYTPVNLGKLIKGGILSDISSIHRMTIDLATEKKEKWR